MFTFESPDGTHLNIKLYDPRGVEIFSQSDQAKGAHGFTTDRDGDFKARPYTHSFLSAHS